MTAGGAVREWGAPPAESGSAPVDELDLARWENEGGAVAADPAEDAEERDE